MDSQVSCHIYFSSILLRYKKCCKCPGVNKISSIAFTSTMQLLIAVQFLIGYTRKNGRCSPFEMQGALIFTSVKHSMHLKLFTQWRMSTKSKPAFPALKCHYLCFIHHEFVFPLHVCYIFFYFWVYKITLSTELSGV